MLAHEFARLALDRRAVRWPALFAAFLMLAVAQRAEAEVLSFNFLTPQSHIAVKPSPESIPGIFDDCVPGPHLCALSIEGSLSLDVDFVARTATFVDVDATLVGEGLFNGVNLLDLLTGYKQDITGTLIDATTIQFKRRKDNAAYVVEFTDSTLHLTGGYDDTAFDGNGVAIDAFALSVLPSDLTSNGFVDFDDLAVLLSNWDKDVSAALGNIVGADSTPVNFDDLAVLLSDWTGPDPAGSPQAALGVASVPEPSSCVMALLGLLLLAARGRFRR